ncbi:hypothetical protein COLO4_31131 [Corchorus olitorius]|uniref:Uncharacterized protein n=1 Tax=Corchorus olitorius TaxID=93759 RepID=A0A1R3H5I0_9ROSI|nr:hypothetical protein COLO4_31131 [Corchorus olitorius]
MAKEICKASEFATVGWTGELIRNAQGKWAVGFTINIRMGIRQGLNG